MFEPAVAPEITTSAVDTDAGTITSAVSILPSESALSDLAAFFPDTFAETDLTQFADTLAGTVTFTDGIISTDLSSEGGTLTEEIDVVAGISSLIDELTGITAAVGLEGGVATADLTLEDGETLTGTLDLNALTETVLLPLLSDIEGTFALNEGIIDIDIDTEAGDFTGELSLLDGELGIDLETPFGSLDESFSFGEDAEFTVPLGGFVTTFDLSEGTVTLSDGESEGLELALVDVPLTFTVDDGFATVSIEPFGDIGEPFDFAAALDSLITPIVAGTDGEFTLSEGVLEGVLDIALVEEMMEPEAPVDPMVPEGPVDPTPSPEVPEEPTAPEESGIPVFVDFAQLLTDASDFLASLTGTISFSGGVAVSDVASDGVDLTGDLNLIELAEDISAAAEFLDFLELIEIDEPVVEGPDTDPDPDPDTDPGSDPGMEGPVVEEPGDGEPEPEPGDEEPEPEDPDTDDGPVIDGPEPEPGDEEPEPEDPDTDDGPVIDGPVIEGPGVEEPGEEEPEEEDPEEEDEPSAEVPVGDEPVPSGDPEDDADGDAPALEEDSLEVPLAEALLASIFG